MLDKKRGGVILICNRGDKGTSRTVRGKMFPCTVCGNAKRAAKGRHAEPS